MTRPNSSRGPSLKGPSSKGGKTYRSGGIRQKCKLIAPGITRELWLPFAASSDATRVLADFFPIAFANHFMRAVDEQPGQRTQRAMADGEDTDRLPQCLDRHRQDV